MGDDGLSIKAQGSVGADSGPGKEWQVKGTGDFDGDGVSDILWQNSRTNAVYIWEIDGNNLGINAQGGVGSDTGPGEKWQVAGTGDFDGDGVSDILWQHKDTGAVYVWKIDGKSLDIKEQGGVGSDEGPGEKWEVAGTGDFDGDGVSDILWRNKNTGAVYVWEIDGKNLGIKAQGGVGSDTGPGEKWEVKGTGDFDGDGKSDILWQNASSGGVYVWEIDDALGIKAQGGVSGNLPGTSTDWHATV